MNHSLSPAGKRFGLFVLAIQFGRAATGSASGGAFYPAYSASGVITEEWKREATETLSSFTWDRTFFFELSEDKIGRWRLTITPDSRERDAFTEHISYDGKDIYSVVYSAHGLDISSGKAVIVPTKNKHPARVCVGPYPVDHSMAVGLVWLAFFGGRYLDPTVNQAHFPNLIVADARTDPVAWSCDLTYRLLDEGARPLVSHGEYRINTNYVHRRVRDYPQLDQPNIKEEIEMVEIILDRLRKPMANPMLTRAVYELIESELFNPGTIRIPKEFRCLVSPKFGFEENGVHLTLKGVVTNVAAAVGLKALLPELVGQITVQDRRVRFKAERNCRKGVFYNLPSNEWITSTNDPTVRAALSQQPPKAY